LRNDCNTIRRTWIIVAESWKRVRVDVHDADKTSDRSRRPIVDGDDSCAEYGRSFYRSESHPWHSGVEAEPLCAMRDCRCIELASRLSNN
jgi:hypothetical protein